MKYFNKIRKALDDQVLEKYSGYIEIGEKIFSQFGTLPIRSERNIFHYLRLGFGLAKCIKEIEEGDSLQEKTAPFFQQPDWEFFSIRMMREYLYNLIKDRKGKIVKDTEDVVCKIINVDGVEFAAEINTFGTLIMGERFYISTKFKKENGYAVLRDLAWSQSKQLSVRYDEQVNSIQIEQDVAGNFISFNLCEIESKEIREFQKKGYSRSILYYGPPGTGKTNLVRGICANLGGRSIKFPELDQLNSNNILSVIEFLKPNCIVFDDIDRCYSDTTSEVLNSLEKINENKNVVFLATANRISSLDDATIRCGRFDKTQEIKIMDPEVLLKIINNDLELFDLVKEMPIAFVQEIMKRIDVFGRDKALNNIQDIFDRVKNMKMSEYEFGDNNE